MRSPHHTTSNVALVGGGANPKPGEITLSHRGILFLDEFPEFPRNVLEALRQPLEDGVVTVATRQRQFYFSGQVYFGRGAKSLPCGYLGDMSKKCVCSPGQVFKYQKKISGPLLDRIDLARGSAAAALRKNGQHGSMRKIRRTLNGGYQVGARKSSKKDLAAAKPTAK